MMQEKNDISIMQRVIINEKNNEDLMKQIDSQDPDKMDYTQILDETTKNARDPKKMSLDLKNKLFTMKTQYAVSWTCAATYKLTESHLAKPSEVTFRLFYY